MQSADGFTYRTRVVTETLGRVEFRLECLDDLNRTIDELFEELQRRGEPELLERYCPYFGTVWPSARALGEVIAELGGALSGASMLELGCGLALPGLLAARLGADVLVTDTHPDVPLFLERNIALNSLAGPRYLEMGWRDEAAIARAGRRFEWVIASDVLYEKQHPAELAEALAALVAPGGTAIVTDPGRPYLQSFSDDMARRGFDCGIAISRVPDHEGTAEIFVLTFTSRRGPSSRPASG